MFVVFASVEIRRRTSNSPSRCRNPLNCVERQRKLLVLWRKPRNTQKPSNNGSLRPKTASHNGAGKSLPPRPASCAPCGLRSELPKPRGKAWRRSASGSRRKPGSLSLSKAWAPTSPASSEKNERLRPHRPRRRCESFRSPLFQIRERRFRLTPRKPVGSSTLRDLQTKATSSEFGLIEKYFCIYRPAPPPPLPL